MLDEAFFPLPYGFPISHGLRPTAVPAPAPGDAGANDIDPSAPPNDNAGAPANGFESTSVERIAPRLEGVLNPPPNPPYAVGVGSGSGTGHIEPSLLPNDSTGGRGAVAPNDDVISASAAADMLLSESDRDSVEERSARGLVIVLGPATGCWWSSCGTGGRSSDGRTLGVVDGEGVSGSGGGADSVRSVGGGMDGGGKRVGWGTCTSSWFSSDLPSTSLIAAKSKPACAGSSEAPRSPSGAAVGDFGGCCAGALVAGVGVEAPSRGGRSSSSVALDSDVLFFAAPEGIAEGGRETDCDCDVLDDFFFRLNHPFFSFSSPSLMTTRSPSKSGSCSIRT